METLKDELARKYGLTNGVSLCRAEGGFISTNYIVETAGKKYFLKQYATNKLSKVQVVHKAKAFFALKGLPVILPIETTDGDTVMSIGDKHHALFPFIEGGVHFKRGEIPETAIKSSARLLADLHRTGKECPFVATDVMSYKTKEEFMERVDELISIISKITTPSTFDTLAFESLMLKKSLVERDYMPLSELKGEDPILIHGDFQDGNIFFDREGRVLKVFDFDKARMGLRAGELWRAVNYMFLNGFFDEHRLAQARLFIYEYRKAIDIDRDELVNGLEVFYQRIIKSLWIETFHYLDGNTRTDVLLENRTTAYLSDHRKQLFQRLVM
ncbi:MAG: phosphotransferase [bacterium]|nr:phosphotransferase [bacterium]